MTRLIRSIARRFLLRRLSVEHLLAVSRALNPVSDLGFRTLDLASFLSSLARTTRHDPPFFVQIGANDGVENDWLFPIVTAYNWPGILVEPLPGPFERLRRNYVGKSGLVFENVGIGANEGDLAFYSLPEEYVEPSWLQQIGSFDRRAIEFNLAHLPDLLEKIQTSIITTIPLKALLDRNNVERVDLLLVDAEGYELTILKQLDQITIRPRAIVFEWGCMQRDDLLTLTKLLVGHGYELFDCGGDLLAVLSDRLVSHGSYPRPGL